MSATKILWGQISIVFLIILATTWGATQYVAWSLGYQAQLGPPWFELFGTPIYYPPAIFWWWYFYEAYAPAIFTKGGLIAASGGFLAIAVAIGMSVWRAREAKNVATYGSARWAERPEIKAAGLLDPDGVVLGRYDQDYLRHDGPEHVLCFAPTRSGKGVGLVVPSLLTWPGSAIVHDIKGENWQLTSGFRARHGRVLLFDPTNPRSSAYNPLLEVRRGEWEVRDVQNIADILVDPEGSLDKRNHWEKTSHSLLVGAILHVLYAEPDKTLAGVARFLSDPKRPVDSTLRAMMKTPHLGEAGPHPVVASAARELRNKSENERSGVLSTAMSFLGLYRDPVVAEVTRRCDWRISDIVSGEEPTTLYLVVPPSDINRTKPLTRDDPLADGRHPDALGNLLDQLAELTGGSRVHVSDLMTGLGQTSFIPLLFVPAIIVLSPLSIVPTLPTVCGLMIALISLQMLMGRNHLWLPQFILRRSVSGDQLQAALRWLRKPAGWIDQFATHRLQILVSMPFSGLLVAACMVAGAAMPLLEVLPFASSILAAAICLITVGLMVRDGVLALIGLGVMWLGFALVFWLVAVATG